MLTYAEYIQADVICELNTFQQLGQCVPAALRPRCSVTRGSGRETVDSDFHGSLLSRGQQIR
jgi:hypothetical protein